MRSPRLLMLALAASVLAIAPGCKGKCRQLSEKLCDCAVNSLDKQNCLTAVSSRESGAPPTAADELQCAELLPGCDCHAIGTTEGKVACGLARPVTDNADAGTAQ